jgi:uncharacterized protein (DUF488 family)
MLEVATIGYQDSSQEAVLAALTQAEVELLVDVRAVTASRRPGFSKSQLTAAVAAAGMDYMHLHSLGTPALGREAARAGRYEELGRIYAAHMATPEAQAALRDLADIVASGRRVCLLCLERRPEHCHRSLIVEALRERMALAPRHLVP